MAANVRALAMCRHSVIRPALTSAESSTKDDILQLDGIYSVAWAGMIHVNVDEGLFVTILALRPAQARRKMKEWKEKDSHKACIKENLRIAANVEALVKVGYLENISFTIALLLIILLLLKISTAAPLLQSAC